MRPTLSWPDIPGRTVGILGLGREGEANLRACRARGIEPVLVDDNPWNRSERVLPTAVGEDFDYWVIEVSSYQAVDMPVSPPVVAVTSLHPDHLPWHCNDPNLYYRDKLSLAAQPGADLTVANGDSALIRGRRALLGPRVRWVCATDDPNATWLTPLHLLGTHNRRNALIARAVMQALGVPEADDPEALATAAVGFGGLESRLQIIGEVSGVTFVDDNLSTNVLSTLAAVEAFPDRRVALIVGGQERGIDYRALGEGLRSRHTPILVLTIPGNGTRIRAMLETANPGPAVTAVDTPDLNAAVRVGYEWARPDGIVLLSPAAASFGHFRNYKERGAVFATAMAACR